MEVCACQPKIDHEHWLKGEGKPKKQPLVKREEEKTVGSWEIKEHHHWLWRTTNMKRRQVVSLSTDGDKVTSALGFEFEGVQPKPKFSGALCSTHRGFLITI